MSKRDRTLLAVIVVIVAAFGFYKFALGPAHRQAAALDTQITSAQTQLAQAEQKYQQGRVAVDGLHRGAATWTASQRAVPATSNIPGFLRLLAREAREAHVDFHSITLADGATSAPAPTAPATGTSTTGSTAATATEIPVSLEIDGGYQAVDRLVRKLSGLVTMTSKDKNIVAVGPLIGIDSVQLSGTKALTFDLTVTIYQHASSATVFGPSSQEGVS